MALPKKTTVKNTPVGPAPTDEFTKSPEIKEPRMPVDENPDVPNEEPELTAQNIDPAFMYSIDTGPNVRGHGFVVRVSHEPKTLERIEDGKELRRFFVFQGGAGYGQFTMPLDEAVAANIQKEGRLTSTELDSWNNWMAVNYVKTS